jgi:methylated-DNA-protein-cysteine methyltransferase related protein
MSKSIAYANLKRAVLAYVRDVPQGRVTTAADLGRALNLPARHVAHLLSQLDADEAESVPCHRVVPKDGRLPREAKSTPAQKLARARLLRERLVLDRQDRIADFEARRIVWPDTHATTIWADEPESDALSS